MEEMRVTGGGANVGFIKATGPLLATLRASSSRLQLRLLLDVYEFHPNQVVSLESCGIFRNGIRIIHTRPEYPSKLIFWCFGSFWCSGSAEVLIDKTRAAGFLPTAPAGSERMWRGIPLRWTAILFVLVWCGLFLLDDVIPRRSPDQPGIFALIAWLSAFLVSLGTKKSRRLQRMILRKDHYVDEIKAYLSLMEIVTPILMVIFCYQFLRNLFQ
jgi:hypothetical protein